MKGLGACVPLVDFISHNFYGHRFVHNTSLCLALDEEKRVWISNKPDPVCGYLFAWGGGGKAKQRNQAPSAPAPSHGMGTRSLT